MKIRFIYLRLLEEPFNNILRFFSAPVPVLLFVSFLYNKFCSQQRQATSQNERGIGQRTGSVHGEHEK